MIITEEEAVRRAKETAGENGWAWSEPIEVNWRYNGWFSKKGKWEILTNTLALGSKIRIVIDDEGRILEQGYIPR